MITRTCDYCKKEYRTFFSIRPRYCSSQCAGLAKRTRTITQCLQCGKDVLQHPSRPRQYCSKSCARTAANLTNKNPSFHRDISGANNPMFGKGLKGKDNPMFGKRREQSPRWTGGKKFHRDGYILSVAPNNHPHPAVIQDNVKYVLEHRLVMEQHLNRYLLPTEVVHHKDGNRRNNSVDNLQLFRNHSEHMKHHHQKEQTTDTPRWRNLRNRITKRDNETCQDCGKKIDNSMPVHHIKPFRDFASHTEANQDSNLVSLCPACHQQKHHFRV